MKEIDAINTNIFWLKYKNSDVENFYSESELFYCFCLGFNIVNDCNTAVCRKEKVIVS